jgi:hypothetical protein
VSDNLVDNFMIFYERDDWHLASTWGAGQSDPNSTLSIWRVNEPGFEAPMKIPPIS